MHAWMQKRSLLAAIGLTVMTATSSWAQVKIGVTLSTTGPGASLGIPEKQTVALFPKELGGQKVEYILLDDASDTTAAVKNMRKFTEEYKVDLVIGSTLSPNSLAMLEVAAETRTPMISIAGASRIVEPMDAKRQWVFKTPQHDSLMAAGIADHMLQAKTRSVAVIAQSDAYGEGWLKEITEKAKERQLTITAVERFNRTDTNVTAQALKMLASKPDAVFVIGAGTSAVLPQKTLKDRGFKGRIYQTHGVANNDFIRVGGKDVEGTVLPAGPVLVAAQLPDSPVKIVALDYVKRFEAANGEGTVTTFGAHAWDAMLLVHQAMPSATAKAKPGTADFRTALRDALEAIRNLTVSHGIVSMSPDDHNGMDARSKVMVTLQNGHWVLLK